jgi:hypothetical protein
MKAYAKERLENAICFFAREHHKRTGIYPTQTMIYKYLAFFDLQVLEERGEPPLELKYKAMKNGPVPIDLYNRRQDLDTDLFCFESQKEKNMILVKAKKVPDMDYFSKYELQKMESLLFMFAQRGIDSETMSTASHQALRTWKKAYARQANSPILFEDAFDGLHSKSEKDLTAAEEHFLIYNSLKTVR